MLQIKDLYSGYDKENVLKGINLVVNRREIVALIGPNGAGKSTIIKSIFNIAKVNKGKIVFKGENINHLKTHKLMALGITYVPQGKINFDNLTIEENLKIGADYIENKEVLNKKLEEIYQKFPVLSTKKNKLAFSLSGGEQQILALGRALIQEPTLILLDEPSLGLSPKLQKQLFEIIKELNQDGISILIVEQNAKKAIEIANKTYLLENGKIVLSGGKDIIKNKKIKNVYLGR